MYNDNSSSPTLTNCTFSGNNGGNGGGIYNNNSSPILKDCTFSGNVNGGNGGGIFNDGTSSSIVTNCAFIGNSSSTVGGAICDVGTGSPTFIDCEFVSNSSTDNSGGAIGVLGGSLDLINCTFSGNSGNASAIEAGGAILNDGNCTITNCIFWGDSGSGKNEIGNSDTASVTVTYSDVAGGYPGTGNIDADPRFVDASADNVALQADSLCINAGNNDAVPSGVTTTWPAVPESSVARWTWALTNFKPHTSPSPPS
jgi:hypothetical protein